MAARVKSYNSRTMKEMPQPHSRDWYAAMTGDYAHPWRQELLEVSGETLFDALLLRHLSAAVTVLEAGCAGGRDAAQFAPSVAHWTGYDFTPGFLETARERNIENASFVDWHSSREPVPTTILERAPFDLVVSRRGPTSVITHLPVLTHEGSRFVAVGPRGVELLEEIRMKLKTVSWVIVWNAVVEARGFLPSFEDYASRAQFNNEPHSRSDFDAGVMTQGFPLLEMRCVIVAQPLTS
jgi:SAM-dependent methyltransferase